MQVFTSQQRLPGETTSDFHNVFTPARKLYGQRLKFKQLQISNSTFNVGSWSLDVDAVAVPMVPGSYTLFTLAAMLQSQINLTMGAGTVAVIGNSSTMALTFTFVAPHALNLLSGASASTSNKLWKVLGFTSVDGLSAVDAPAALVITSPMTVFLAYPLALFVHLEMDYNTVNPIDIGTNHSTASFIVPLTSVVGSITLVKESDIDFYLEPSSDCIRSVRFTVRDEAGALVDLHNADWFVVFQLV